MIATNDLILKKFSRQIVMYPSFERAYGQLERAQRATELRGVPSCAMLIGDSGVGKSQLCNLFGKSFGNNHKAVEKPGITNCRPVFYCTVPAPVTIKGFQKTILTRLGHPNAAGDSVDLTYEVIQAITTARLELIIFDEFQRLTKPSAYKNRQLTIDWLVALLGEIKIQIIISGTRECHLLLHDAPLARRYPYLATLDYLSFVEREDSEFTQTLRGLDDAMYDIAGLDTGIHFQDISMSLPLYVATVGNLEYLRQILYFALDSCLSRGDRKLQRNDFAEACNCLSLPYNLLLNEIPFNHSQATCIQAVKKHEEKKRKETESERAAIRSFTTGG